MFTIYGGKAEFNQWDLDQLVTCSCLQEGDKVVFSGFGKAYETTAFVQDGEVLADVPNFLLKEPGYIRVDLGWGLACHMDCRTTFTVVKKNKPEDYVCTYNIKHRSVQASGGVSSWNDLTDKPFWEEEGLVAFVDNEPFISALNSSFGAYIVDLGMALEEMPLMSNCVVVWDGESKEHSIVAAEMDGATYHGFGNLSFFASFGIAGENTGEPYAFFVMPDGYTYIFTTDTTAAKHTVSVLADATVYHGMEQTYLDIPMLNLVALGLPDVLQSSETVSVNADLTEIHNMLLRNKIIEVRFRLTGYRAPLECTALVARSTSTLVWSLTAFVDSCVYFFRVDINNGEITARRTTMWT